MSIIKFPIDKLEEKCGTKFALSVVVSKRVKELLQGQKPLVEPDEGDRYISIASKEVFKGVVYPVFED